MALHMTTKWLTAAQTFALTVVAASGAQTSSAMIDSTSNDPKSSFQFKYDPAASVALTAVAEGENPWRFSLDTWLWAMGINGTVGARGLQVDVDSSFIDVLDESDSLIGIMGRMEVGYDKWTLFADGFYTRIAVDDVSGPLGFGDVDVVNKLGLVDFGLMYRVYEGEARPEHTNEPRALTLDAYVGGRYTTLEVELKPALLPDRQRDRDWIDPIVGAKLVAPLGERWELRLWGDIGGFGVSSDLTWSATALLGYGFELFNMHASIFGGYRAIGQDYSTGSAANAFKWDVILHGPIIGLRLEF